MRQWKTVKRELILDYGKFLKIEQHTIELPNGTIVDHWPWIISPDYALVLPVSEKKTIHLFRQVKYAVHGTSRAPVGGYLEPGEDPLTAAKRELREEMGCESDTWISLGKYPNNGNHGNGSGHLFIAYNVRKAGEPIVDDLEEMQRVELTIEQLEETVLQGEVKVMGWVAMIAMGLLYVKHQEK